MAPFARQAQECDEMQQTFADFISTVVTETARSAKLAQVDVAELDELAQGIGKNVVWLQETKALLESGMDSTQLAQKLKQLEASREAGDMPMQKIKKCEEYADFAGEFCEVKDDDDIVCASSSLPEKDELTLAALDLVRGSDGNERWPVALSCKHVYNWSTLTEKKPDGSWALSACVVAGCRSGTVPALLKDRQKLKEDPRVKHALQKKARKRGGRASVDSFDVDEEDD